MLQLFVRTASSRDTEVNGKIINPLNEWGELVGAGLPTSASQAELLLDITVTNQTGSLPAFTQLVGAGNGVTYLTTSAVLLDAPFIQVSARASGDQSGGDGSGAIGNLDTGSIVSFVNPLANVERDTVVDSQVVTGADGESAEAYRQRVLDRFQKRPQGGALADYELWGEEVEGIINVYPYRSDCPGQVDLYCEATEASSGSPDGFPTTAQLEAVLESTQLDDNGLATRRPAGALVNTFSISRVTFNVQITNLQVDDIVQVLTDIEIALTDYYAARQPFITGLTPLPREDRVTAAAAGGVVDDVVSAAGGTFDSLAQSIGTTNTQAYSLGIGEKAKLGTLSNN